MGGGFSSSKGGSERERERERNRSDMWSALDFPCVAQADRHLLIFLLQCQKLVS